MNILLVGGGGREHTIIKKLRQNPEVETIYALPGNGGIAADATCVDVKATDIEGIAAFARSTKIDYAVVAPDDPLVLGCVDALEAEGIPCFGPRKNAAIIEGSKVFSKDLMKKSEKGAGIPGNLSDSDGNQGGRPGPGQGRDRGHEPLGSARSRAGDHGRQEVWQERRSDRH